MIRIAGPDFNKDMSSYMDYRRNEVTPFEMESHKEKQTVLKTQETYESPVRSRSFLQSLAILFRKRIPSDDEIQAHIKQLDEEEKVKAEDIKEEIEEIEEAEDELEMEKESLMRKLLRKIGFYTSREVVSDEELETIQEEQVMVDEETKETIKLLHKWLKQLPPDKLDSFRKSQDFVKYKELLRRLGMIKE